MKLGAESLLAFARVARTVGSRKIQEIRARVTWVAILGGLALVFALAAFGLLMTALAVWLAQFMELWQALLAVSMLLVVVSGLLLILARAKARARRDNDILRTISEAEESLREIEPTTIVLAAAVLGFILARNPPK